MSTLFRRDWRVTLDIQQSTVALDRLDLVGVRTEFEIEKTGAKHPNTGKIKLTNLSAETRAKIVLETDSKGNAKPPLKLLLEAGYEGTRAVLFSGTVRAASHELDGVTWTTTLECGDGEHQYTKSRINESYRPGTDLVVVASDIAGKMGLGLGNLKEALAAGPLKTKAFRHGFSAHGRASDELARVLGAAGFEYSIQDGQLQVVRPGATTEEQVVLLTAKSGLIGKPSFGEKNAFKVKSLLQPSIRPGRPLRVESSELTANLVPEKVVHRGDSHGQDWYTEIEAKRL